MKLPFQIALFSALLFAAGLGLFTRSNRFPFYRHPDEPVKVAQVQTGDWNFHHPMLLVGTARLVMAASGTDLRNPQAVVETGRWVSAGFAAGAAALFAAAMWIAAGRFAGVAMGLLLLSNHQLFELAHYFKEDTALVFGIAAWLLALALYERRPTWSKAALIGIGAALAVSGKYVGAFAPVLSLWVLAKTGLPERRGARFAAFFAALALSLAAVNAPMLTHQAKFETSFQRELALVVHGQRGMTRSVPHAVYLNAFRDNLHFALWIFIPLALWAAWRHPAGAPRLVGAVEAVVLLLPIVYMAALSFSPKVHDRYFLPSTVLFLGSVALGMKALKWQKALPFLLAAAVGLQIAGLPKHDLLSYCKAFRTDDRADLVAWLNARPTRPGGDVIVQDRRTLLPTPAQPAFLPYQPSLSARVLPEALEKYSGLDELRAEGVTLAALCQDDFGRFDLKSQRPQQGTEDAYRRTGELYRALRQGRQPLWERPRGLVLYLHPGLKVYTLPE